MAEKHTTLAQMRTTALRTKAEFINMLIDVLTGRRVGITLTLPKTGWVSSAQIIQNEALLADRSYWYLVGFDPDCLESGNASGVTADNITEDGRIVFRCESVPTKNLTVRVLRLETETPDSNANIGVVLNLTRRLAELYADIDGRIEAAIQTYDGKWSAYEVPQPLRDSAGEAVLDDGGEDLSVRLLLATM